MKVVSVIKKEDGTETPEMTAGNGMTDVAKKRKMFCRDCLKKKTCRENPADCMNSKEAKLYFELYDLNNVFDKLREGSG